MSTSPSSLAAKEGLHYGWIVLAVSTLTVMGCLGFARFGYTMILPAMQTALGLSNTQTGVLATGNFVGYLAMATISGFVASRYGPRRVIALFMLLTALGMGLTGLAGGFWGAIAWRVLTGVGSGGSNVPVMALLSSWFAPRRRGLASGIAVSGSGLALIVIGFLIPRILNAYGANGWRYSWYALGTGVLLLGILAFVMLRERPDEKGLRPVGAQAPDHAEPHLSVSDSAQKQAAAPDWGLIYRSSSLWHLSLVYVAFGFSYVIYTTFFAKYLQAEAGYTKEAAGSLWTIVGWISIVCGLIWGSVSDAIGRQYGLALVYGLQAISFALFAWWRAPAGHVLSAVFFGLTAWSIPGIVAAACGDCVGARLAPAAFGFVTLFFGLGQAIGPSVAGALADKVGSFGPAFLLAAGVALIGSVASLLLRPECDVIAA